MQGLGMSQELQECRELQVGYAGIPQPQGLEGVGD